MFPKAGQRTVGLRKKQPNDCEASAADAQHTEEDVENPEDNGRRRTEHWFIRKWCALIEV
jgi:hypothetical protein